MSVRKYYTEDLNKFASTHTMRECSKHYNINIGGIYSLFKKYGINYKRIEKKVAEHKKVDKKNDQFYIAKWMGELKPKTELDGWYMLALSVFAYAKIDNCNEFPTRKLFTEAIEVKNDMYTYGYYKTRHNGILI